jgi:hypothetical protein
LRLSFDNALRMPPSRDDLLVRNLTTNTTVPASALALTYAPQTHTVTVTFPGYARGVLPDGNYRATLSAAGVEDDAGRRLASDYTLDFFVLAGDINRDRAVNGSDFAILAGNFGQTGMGYGGGDLNADGSVNGSDFAILAGNFGRSVPAAEPAASVSALARASAARFPTAAPVRRGVRITAPARQQPRPRRISVPGRLNDHVRRR